LKSLRPKELLGVALIKNGYYVESVPLLQEAIRLYPRSANEHYMLGVAYIELQNYDLGKKFLLKAKKLDPLNLLYKKAYFELIESK
jgi:tetratricopeptide (TPR) repeat protein